MRVFYFLCVGHGSVQVSVLRGVFRSGGKRELRNRYVVIVPESSEVRLVHVVAERFLRYGAYCVVAQAVAFGWDGVVHRHFQFVGFGVLLVWHDINVLVECYLVLKVLEHHLGEDVAVQQLAVVQVFSHGLVESLLLLSEV